MAWLGRLAVALLALTCLVLALLWYASGQMVRRRATIEGVHPKDFGLPYEEVIFAARDGVTIHGWLMPPKALPAKGTVILVHGHSGILKRDVKVAAALHAAGYQTLLMDLRAYGPSGGKVLSFGTYERLDVLGALDYLAGRGMERVGIVGFSMGAP